MDRRGGTSFAIFLILNPILILFFQNCSVVPDKTASAALLIPTKRQIASVESPVIESCRFISDKVCAD
jgi:hypothetical protein